MQFQYFIFWDQGCKRNGTINMFRPERTGNSKIIFTRNGTANLGIRNREQNAFFLVFLQHSYYHSDENCRVFFSIFPITMFFTVVALLGCPDRKNRKIGITQNSTGRFLLFIDMLCKIVYFIKWAKKISAHSHLAP